MFAPGNNALLHEYTTVQGSFLLLHVIIMYMLFHTRKDQYVVVILASVQNRLFDLEIFKGDTASHG